MSLGKKAWLKILAWFSKLCAGDLYYEDKALSIKSNLKVGEQNYRNGREQSCNGLHIFVCAFLCWYFEGPMNSESSESKLKFGFSKNLLLKLLVFIAWMINIKASFKIYFQSQTRMPKVLSRGVGRRTKIREVCWYTIDSKVCVDSESEMRNMLDTFPRSRVMTPHSRICVCFESPRDVSTWPNRSYTQTRRKS